MDGCKYCNPKAKTMIVLMDENGDPITNDRIDVHSYDQTIIRLRIKDCSKMLTKREITHLKLLICDAIEYGVKDVSIAREYLELLDKLDKIKSEE